MAFALKLTSSLGEFDFLQHRVPLFNRRIGMVRMNEQGPSMRRIDCTLNGFFPGNKNDEVMAKIESLINILKSNQVQLLYNDGVRDIVNRQVWVADYSDPSEWKSYVGNYAINLYYFEDAVQPAGESIAVSYVTDSANYVFDIAPTISHAIKATRSSHRQSRKTPSGVDIGDTMQITLQGFLRGISAADLETKRQTLLNAFSKDGTLNYGSLTIANVRIAERDIPQVFPMDHLDYSIKLMYDSPTGIVEFSATREFSRIHANPIIRDRPYCGSPFVQLLSSSGQTVNYNMKIVGYDITSIRNLLNNEASLMVFPSGVELPGGKELWDENEVSVTLQFSKYHATPVLANLGGTMV
jgi:hypothetical protein